MLREHPDQAKVPLWVTDQFRMASQPAKEPQSRSEMNVWDAGRPAARHPASQRRRQLEALCKIAWGPPPHSQFHCSREGAEEAAGRPSASERASERERSDLSRGISAAVQRNGHSHTLGPPGRPLHHTAHNIMHITTARI
jgi:hypothetical protein